MGFLPGHLNLRQTLDRDGALHIIGLVLSSSRMPTKAQSQRCPSKVHTRLQSKPAMVMGYRQVWNYLFFSFYLLGGTSTVSRVGLASFALYLLVQAMSILRCHYKAEESEASLLPSGNDAKGHRRKSLSRYPREGHISASACWSRWPQDIAMALYIVFH